MVVIDSLPFQGRPPKSSKFDKVDYGCRNPTLGLSVKMQLTLPKVGKWSPPGLPKTQKTI